MNKNNLIHLILATFIPFLQGQILFINKGVAIKVNPNTKIGIRNGSFQNDTNGVFQHAGYLLIEGNFVNEGDFENMGVATVKVQQGFYNNKTFEPSNGLVELYGSDQAVGGLITNNFYNLEISGSGIKTLKNHAGVQNTLQLNHLELATEEYDLTVANPDLEAIKRTTGFVSSLGDGALYRNTNLQQDYLFPVGSSLSPARYRPIIIHPDDSENTFGVRLANTNATNEGLNVQQTDINIKTLNDQYYHRIYQPNGNANAEILFTPLATDGDWDALAFWDIRWKNIENQVVKSGNSLEIQNWETKPYIPYILARLKHESIYIPNIFSPNGDGENDYFAIFANNDIELIVKMEIFDRWGNLVYSAKDLIPNASNTFWDGTWNGKSLNPGVFVYQLLAKKTDGINIKINGEITLIK
jgi:gliding motility-associated-like protein